MLDGQATDEDAGRAIATALTTGCSSPPTVREITQTSSDLLAVSNPTTGQPVAGADELLITAGGFFFEKVVGYEEQRPSAPIYAKQIGQTDEYLRHSDDSVVSTFSATEDTSDYVFTIQLIRDPASGSLILNAQGFFPGATSIASEYLSTVIIPALSTYTKTWYVFHWVDSAGGDHMMQPSEVTLVQSG